MITIKEIWTREDGVSMMTINLSRWYDWDELRAIKGIDQEGLPYAKDAGIGNPSMDVNVDLEVKCKVIYWREKDGKGRDRHNIGI
jgi:hypothetical protein